MTESRRWFLKWVCAPALLWLLFIVALIFSRPSRFRLWFLAVLALGVACGLTFFGIVF